MKKMYHQETAMPHSHDRTMDSNNTNNEEEDTTTTMSSKKNYFKVVNEKSKI